MSVLTLELPGHLHYAALEEMLLLQALANLSAEGKPMASFLSMCTRNEIVCAAQHMLTGQQREQFLIYAEQLACAICGDHSGPAPANAGDYNEPGGASSQAFSSGRERLFMVRCQRGGPRSRLCRGHASHILGLYFQVGHVQ